MYYEQPVQWDAAIINVHQLTVRFGYVGSLMALWESNGITPRNPLIYPVLQIAKEG